MHYIFIHTANIKRFSALQAQTALRKRLSSQLEEKSRLTNVPYVTALTKKARGGLRDRPCARGTSADKCRNGTTHTHTQTDIFLEYFTDGNILDDSGE